MSDELDDYEEGAERAEAREGERERELELVDAAELGAIAAEQYETRFDETRRLAYSGVEEGDDDVDVQELEESGTQLERPPARGTAERSFGARRDRLSLTLPATVHSGGPYGVDVGGPHRRWRPGFVPSTSCPSPGRCRVAVVAVAVSLRGAPLSSPCSSPSLAG
jgi:hypothetical protein